MERNSSELSFFARLGMACRLLFNSAFAAEVSSALQAQCERAAQASVKVAPEPLEKVHASGLLLLAALQREGRLVDFLQQDVASYSDEEIGAAARVVHSGCRKVLQDYFAFEPAMNGDEGSPMSIPAGFDAERIRLTGNVSGQPPFKGMLKHHGWIAKDIRMPSATGAINPRVIAPAEVELS